MPPGTTTFPCILVSFPSPLGSLAYPIVPTGLTKDIVILVTSLGALIAGWHVLPTSLQVFTSLALGTVILLVLHFAGRPMKEPQLQKKPTSKRGRPRSCTMKPNFGFVGRGCNV